jgi:hypothetical protein
VAHGPSIPPPSDNTATAAWYRAGRALDLLEGLEARLLLNLGQISADVRALKLANRRSGHRLEEVEDWKETSEVRDMRKELAEATAKLEARAEARKVWAKRVWGLTAALILTAASAIIREFMRH